MKTFSKVGSEVCANELTQDKKQEMFEYLVATNDGLIEYHNSSAMSYRKRVKLLNMIIHHTKLIREMDGEANFIR